MIWIGVIMRGNECRVTYDNISLVVEQEYTAQYIPRSRQLLCEVADQHYQPCYLLTDNFSVSCADMLTHHQTLYGISLENDHTLWYKNIFSQKHSSYCKVVSYVSINIWNKNNTINTAGMFDSNEDWQQAWNHNCLNYLSRLLGRPQPQMYPPVALNQYTWVNRTHKFFLYMLQGPMKILKSRGTKVSWRPHHTGDISTTKKNNR